MNSSQIKCWFGGSLLLLTFLYSLAIGFGQNSNYFEETSSEVLEDVTESIKENSSDSKYHFQGGKGNSSAVSVSTRFLVKCVSLPYAVALSSGDCHPFSEAPLYILYCSLKVYS